jgi:hypothetical protein
VSTYLSLLRHIAVPNDSAPSNKLGPDAAAGEVYGSEPSPEPAVPAILAAFDKYEVVGMPEAHGFKDVDDCILSLVRNPAVELHFTTGMDLVCYQGCPVN